MNDYQIIDVINEFNTVVERHGDGKMSFDSAKAKLAMLVESSKDIGCTLPEPDEALKVSVDDYMLIHLQFKDLLDQFIDHQITEKVTSKAASSLKEIANEKKVPIYDVEMVIKFLKDKKPEPKLDIDDDGGVADDTAAFDDSEDDTE